MSDPTRILFLGTSAFALPSLEALAGDPRFRIDAVVTQPDRPVGRKQTVTPPPVKEAALRLRIPVHQPENLSEAFGSLRLPQADFLVVVSYGQILSQDILDAPRIAPVNVHASLLPRFRGASPIQHALLAGDAETGVTVQHMVRELDAGPILGQARLAIAPRETARTLHDKLAALGASLLQETLSGPLHPVGQVEEDVVLCHKLERSDGDVDPRAMTAEEIDRRVRALQPWPGVTVSLEGERVKLLATDLFAHANSVPLPCMKDSTLHLVTIQPAGKKPMGGAEWSRGKR